jgi:hypothetical protein
MNFKFLINKKGRSNKEHLLSLLFKYELFMTDENTLNIHIKENSISFYFNILNGYGDGVYINSLDLFCDKFIETNDFNVIEIYSRICKNTYMIFYQGSDFYYVDTPFSSGAATGPSENFEGCFLVYGKYKKEYDKLDFIKSRDEIYGREFKMGDCSILISKFQDILRLKQYLIVKKLTFEQVKQLNDQDFLKSLEFI